MKKVNSDRKKSIPLDVGEYLQVCSTTDKTRTRNKVFVMVNLSCLDLIWNKLKPKLLGTLGGVFLISMKLEDPP